MQTYLTSNKRLSDLTDDDLIQHAQIGNQDAFEMLVERYSASLFLLISHIVRDEDAAHDVLQHVFIQLYRSLPNLLARGTIRPWLSQVARHRAIDELRRKRPIFFSEIEVFPSEDEYSYLITILDPALQPEEQVEWYELRRYLLNAIETLASPYREVVLLRYETHQSYREIGLALCIPETTAKTYFHRAKKQLRILLELEFVHY